MNPELPPDVAKTKTFSSFAIQNLEAMRLLRKFGLLSQSHEERGKKAWGKLGDTERSYRNIAEHSLVVGMTADIIFEKLQEKGLLTAEERVAGTKGAVLHDLLKRAEIEAQYANDRPDQSKYLSSEELQKIDDAAFEHYGISKEDVREYALARRTTFDAVGVPPEQIDLTGSPNRLQEWVIFFSDWSVAHTNIVSPEERFRDIRNRGFYQKTYTEKYRQLFGDEALKQLPNPEDATEEILRINKSQIDVVEEQLKSMLDIPKEVRLVDFIRQNLETRYRSAKQP